MPRSSSKIRKIRLFQRRRISKKTSTALLLSSRPQPHRLTGRQQAKWHLSKIKAAAAHAMLFQQPALCNPPTSSKKVSTSHFQSSKSSIARVWRATLDAVAGGPQTHSSISSTTTSPRVNSILMRVLLGNAKAKAEATASPATNHPLVAAHSSLKSQNVRLLLKLMPATGTSTAKECSILAQLRWTSTMRCCYREWTAAQTGG